MKLLLDTHVLLWALADSPKLSRKLREKIRDPTNDVLVSAATVWEIEIKKRIGLVPDESLLFDRLTGTEFLEFVGRMYGLARGVSRERARGLMALFELDENRRKLIAEYSKGMRKRVAMAASLIHHPELFLMDEPFEGVDAVGARLMKDILLDQVRQGATIFLTSHVLEVVERLCDRVAIIHDGKIVTEGTLADLRAGSETLEDVFVRVVGAERDFERLDWLER